MRSDFTMYKFIYKKDSWVI